MRWTETSDAVDFCGCLIVVVVTLCLICVLAACTNAVVQMLGGMP